MGDPPLAFHRMLPVLLSFLIWRSSGHPLAAIRAVGVAGILGGFSLVGAFGGIIFAIQTTTVANAVFLLAASPLLVSSSWCAKTSPGGRRWAISAR